MTLEQVVGRECVPSPFVRAVASDYYDGQTETAMLVTIDGELINICEDILSESKSPDQWAEIESDDMFQSDHYQGGYDANETSFLVQLPRSVRMGRNRRLSILLVSIMVCGILVYMYKQSSDGHTILFLIPNDFKGVVCIVEDKHDGIAVDIDSRWIELQVPNDGVVRVRDLAFIYRWNRIEAKWYSGAPLSTEYGPELGADELYFMGLSGDDESAWFMVGTQSEKEQHYENLAENVLRIQNGVCTDNQPPN